MGIFYFFSDEKVIFYNNILLLFGDPLTNRDLRWWPKWTGTPYKLCWSMNLVRDAEVL